MKSTHSSRTSIFIILAATIFTYLPIILSPSVIFNRNNDLQQFFWPVFHYVKDNVSHGTLPLWNTLWFSGMPLLPDPQFSLFYPPNILFLVLPIDQAFVVNIILHIALGGVCTYILSKIYFKFTNTSSIFTGILFLTTPKLAGYLEAGHVGLVYSLGWLPCLLLSFLMLLKTIKIKWAILLGVSIAGLFYSHTIILLLSLIAFSFLTAILLLLKEFKLSRKLVFLFSISGVLSLGLTAVALLPQIEWLRETTRFLLLTTRDVYPKWDTRPEFVISILFPWIRGINNLWEIDSEKWIALGFIPGVMAVYGLFQLKKWLKIIISILIIVVVLIMLNNVSPLYHILIKSDFYVLSRVATRLWFVPLLTGIILAGLTFEKLVRKANTKKLAIIIALLAISESILLSWFRLYKPIEQNPNLAQKEVYEFLAKDKDKFRVFCLTRCLSQQKAAEYKLELVEGYNTIQQNNYYKEFIQLSQVFWDRYTLALPPFEIYKFQEIQPYTPELADYNVKYIISPHLLTDKKLIPKEKFGDYTIYLNTINKGRSYFSDGTNAPVLYYSPNTIKVDVSSRKTSELILSEVWSPGWNAYLNGQKMVEIKELKNALRQTELKEDTKFVVFKYEPKSYKIGSVVTTLTLIMLLFYLIKSWKRQFYY